MEEVDPISYYFVPVSTVVMARHSNLRLINRFFFISIIPHRGLMFMFLEGVQSGFKFLGMHILTGEAE